LSGALLSQCLLLWAALCSLSACGRLGYGLLDVDAGAGSRSDGTSTGPALDVNDPAGGVLTGMPRDAGVADAAPARAADPSAQKDAGVSDSGLVATVPRLENGAVCDRDSVCVSGACVSGMCCESHCDTPGVCHAGVGTSCMDGRCVYGETEPDGTSCDDGNVCTTNDLCIRGYCLGAPRSCDDTNDCTSDFCTAGSCTHAASCDPGDGCSYGLFEDHGYWLCSAAVSFDAARAECERVGAHLVTIDSPQEQAYLWQHGMRDTWIGYRRASASSGAGFEWVTGDSQFDAWASGEPDAGTDGCAYISASHGGAWESHACDDSAGGFACELEQYAPPDTHCKYLRGYEQGYFLCKGPRTYWDAAARCESVHAALAEVSGLAEQGYLATFLETGTRYAIGLNDRGKNGQLTWLSGAMLAFTAWDEMQPADSQGAARYVVMDGYSGKWSTTTSSERLGYVCEQKR
jgi:hypothetical protein